MTDKMPIPRTLRSLEITNALPTMRKFGGAQNQTDHTLRGVFDLVVGGTLDRSAIGELPSHRCDAVNDPIRIGTSHRDAAAVQGFRSLQCVSNRNRREFQHRGFFTDRPTIRNSAKRAFLQTVVVGESEGLEKLNQTSFVFITKRIKSLLGARMCRDDYRVTILLCQSVQRIEQVG